MRPLERKARAFLPGFSVESRTVIRAFKKISLVLPSTLIAGVFLDRLFLSAAEGPFFNTFFFWFGSHSLKATTRRYRKPTAQAQV